MHVGEKKQDARVRERKHGEAVRKVRIAGEAEVDGWMG
jgi:hypothetical protein